MRAVHAAPATGLVAQVVVLTTLAFTAGLGAPGWITGAAFAFVTAVLLQRAMSHLGIGTLGPADWVTLTRTTLVGGAAALIADAFFRDPPTAVLVSAVTVALLLDGVDGQVARWTGTVSGFGAHFDQEVDSFLLLALGVFVARSTGWWVLAIGGMRYAFAAAGWLLPRMRTPLPFRFWRKVVAAVQGIALLVAASGLLPTPLTLPLLGAALVLLLESFGRDVVWLCRSGTGATASARMARMAKTYPDDVTGRISVPHAASSAVPEA